jgi:hypothetical protein
VTRDTWSAQVCDGLANRILCNQPGQTALHESRSSRTNLCQYNDRQLALNRDIDSGALLAFASARSPLVSRRLMSSGTFLPLTVVGGSSFDPHPPQPQPH